MTDQKPDDDYVGEVGRMPLPATEPQEGIPDEALDIAAQCWCDPETSGTIMDTALGTAFAKRLVPYLALKVDVERLRGIVDGCSRCSRMEEESR